MIEIIVNYWSKQIYFDKSYCNRLIYYFGCIAEDEQRISSSRTDDNSLFGLAIRKFNLKKKVVYLNAFFRKVYSFLICEQVTKLFSLASISRKLTRKLPPFIYTRRIKRFSR